MSNHGSSEPKTTSADGTVDVSRPAGVIARHPVAFAAGILLLVALAAYGNSFNNRALFHHEPNIYGDPLLEDPILRSPTLFPKIFTGAFMLTSYGEYRPVGYALFAVIKRALPDMSEATVWPWHVILLVLHGVTAIILFLMLRSLLEDATAGWLAAVYLLHPLFVPFVNDVNMIHVLWGLLFSALALWLYVVSLKKRCRWARALSIVAFAASVFTYKGAIVLPPLLGVVAVFHDRRPRTTVSLLVYFALGAVGAAVLRAPAAAVLGGLCVVACVAGSMVPIDRQRYRILVGTLLPYALIVGLYWLLPLVAPTAVNPSPLVANILLALERTHLSDPFQPWFPTRAAATASMPFVISLGVAALVPAALLLRKGGRHAAMLVCCAFLLVTTLRANSAFRNDVRYWGALYAQFPQRAPILLNLATAHIEHQQWEEARGLLMHALHDWEVHPVVLDTIRPKLATAHAGLGNDKLAGYYFLYCPPFGWDQKVMKNRLNDIADFFFRKGYPSTAENHWASALVPAPYDTRLYNNLGRALVYKNFFRAAAHHFRHVLTLEPDNPTALYYLAFVGKVLNDKRTYDASRAEWEQVTRSENEIDFQPIYDGFPAQTDRTRRWFSGDPMTMFMTMCGRAENAPREKCYLVTLKGTTYRFPEVPLDVAKHFVRKGDYASAREYLTLAGKVDPTSKEISADVAALQRRMNSGDAATPRDPPAGGTPR